ncbi:BZ3500_MvSof-1268-A1-R1_Chr2-1g04615 [Microbotryum saponariae]|uniref:BZ3500_MvSof-1268-A1-R1_Chr2-1g04615 protein n=1 Tax=Microbotryum saponariae TaxID=289078 RepID=A0A2X0KZS4_9BASI|nr:BZ3500_MvSof-1268-A1-R1_Chr2-1g04615 [Microbotryum saponariae]SCZ92135.1 BZ3501_MvSof-1269-A2-R1_Chr2-1g04271 [Microbotryum saponariae]
MNDSEQMTSMQRPCDVEEVNPVGSLGSDVANGRLVPRVPIYYDRQFMFTFTNASLFSLAPSTSSALGLPNAFSVPQCSLITWQNNCVSGEDIVPLILMVVPIDSEIYASALLPSLSRFVFYLMKRKADFEKSSDPIMQPTRYISNSRCADGAHWVADLPVVSFACGRPSVHPVQQSELSFLIKCAIQGQRVLFGFFDAHGHYGGLTRNPYVITGATSALKNTNEPIPQANSTGDLSNSTRPPCKMATELSTPIELALYPPSNPCNYLLLQINGGHGPFTLTILNPDKATWADISVDTTSTVLLTNISDPGSTIVSESSTLYLLAIALSAKTNVPYEPISPSIVFAVDKNLVRSQVTGEYKLGFPGTCNNTMDTIIEHSLYDSNLVATRRKFHLELIIPTAVTGFICLILCVLAIRKCDLLAQRVRRWRGVVSRDSSMLDERAQTGSETIIKPDGPSSCSLPSKCTPVHSQSKIQLSKVEMSSHHGNGHINEHGALSTVVALAGTFDPKTTMPDKLRKPPHVVSKPRHSDTLTRNYNAGDSSVELMQLASPGSGSEGGGSDSPDMGTSLGHAHRSSVPKLLIPTDSALMLEKVRSGSDKEKTPTTIGLADPNEFVFRNAGWNLSTNRNTSTSQAAAAPGLAASAPVPPLPVLPTVPRTPSPQPAVQSPPSPKRNSTTPPAMQSPWFDRGSGTNHVPIPSIRE